MKKNTIFLLVFLGLVFPFSVYGDELLQPMEFLSYQQKVISTQIYNDGKQIERYETVSALTKDGSQIKTINFSRTKILKNESVNDAAGRIKEVCAEIKKLTPDIPEKNKAESTWHDQINNTVSCLNFIK